MKRRGVVGLLGLCVLMAVVAVVGFAKLAAARAENEVLRSELDQQGVALSQLGRDAQFLNEPRLPQNEKMELMRLRAEVTQLRASAEAAREAVKDALENRERGTRQADLVDPQGRSLGETEFPKEQWGFRGYATPEDTLVSEMWAVANGDLQRVVEGLSAGEREQWQAKAAGKTEEELKAGLMREYGNVTTLKIQEERQVSPTEVVLNVEMGTTGQSVVRQLHFQLEGNEWKMQSLVNTYDPLAFYRRNPELMRRYFPHLFRGDLEQQPDPPAQAQLQQQPAMDPAMMRRYFPHLVQDQQQTRQPLPAGGQGTLPPEPAPNQ